MSWLFSQALVEAYLGDTFLDGEQSAPSSGSHTQQAYCAPDKMTAFSRISRFGMTYKPLMESHGEALLTSYRAAFHAKTFQSQETEMDLMESEAECGEKWHGLLARFDQNLHSWRTVQCSLLEDLNESLQTLPEWGMTVDGELYLLPTLVQTIDAKESGFTHVWGTPKAQDSRHALRDRGKGNLGEQVSGLHNGGKLNPTWTEWLMGWPLEWTDLKPLAMDKFPYAQQQHGNYSVKEFND
jgi:hypothetical protein